MAKRSKRTKHGGRRPGAGRPAGDPKRVISPRISEAAFNALGDNPTKKAGEIIENWAIKNK